MKASLLTTVTVLAITLFGCAGSPTPAPTLPRSMKGYELYSWVDGYIWHFALVIGTNREKTVGEIKGSPNVVEGVEGLRDQIARLSEGEEVFWMGRSPDFTLPAGRDIDQIREYARKGKVRLIAGY